MWITCCMSVWQQINTVCGQTWSLCYPENLILGGGLLWGAWKLQVLVVIKTWLCFATLDRSSLYLKRCEKIDIIRNGRWYVDKSFPSNPKGDKLVSGTQHIILVNIAVHCSHLLVEVQRRGQKLKCHTVLKTCYSSRSMQNLLEYCLKYL